MRTKVIVFLMAAIMVIVIIPVQAQKLASRKKTQQLRLAKTQMDRANTHLAQLEASKQVSSDLNRQIKVVEKRIDSLKKVVSKTDSTSDQFFICQSLLYDNKTILDGLKRMDNVPSKVRDEASYWAQQSQIFTEIYDSIARDAATNPRAYNGLKKRELEDLLRYNILERNTKALDAEDAEFSQAVSSGDEMIKIIQTKNGRVVKYGGVVLNECSSPVDFRFIPLDGGEEANIRVNGSSAYSGAKGWNTIFLIAGNYLVHIKSGERDVCEPFRVTVGRRPTSLDLYDPATHNTESKHCFFYAYARNTFNY